MYDRRNTCFTVLKPLCSVYSRVRRCTRVIKLLLFAYKSKHIYNVPHHLCKCFYMYWAWTKHFQKYQKIFSQNLFLFTHTYRTVEIHVFTLLKPLYSVYAGVHGCTRVTEMRFVGIQIKTDLYCSSPPIHVSMHVLSMSEIVLKTFHMTILILSVIRAWLLTKLRISYDIFSKTFLSHTCANMEILESTVPKPLWFSYKRVRRCTRIINLSAVPKPLYSVYTLFQRCTGLTKLFHGSRSRFSLIRTDPWKHTCGLYWNRCNVLVNVLKVVRVPLKCFRVS